MTPVDFFGIAVVGALWTIVHAWINKKYDVESTTNKALVILAAVVLGLVYFVLRQTSWWEPIVGVLAASSTFYALFVNGKAQ